LVRSDPLVVLLPVTVFHYCSDGRYEEVYFIAMLSMEELTSLRKYSLSTEPVVRGVIMVHDF
jgi:hypothetical protein